MEIYSRDIAVKAENLFDFEVIYEQISQQLQPDEAVIRMAVTKTDGERWNLALGIIKSNTPAFDKDIVLKLRKRKSEDTSSFNVALTIPTGVGCSSGGHAGDANNIAISMGSVCDNLILHPNVVNASDINEMPRNALYVEGSQMSRLLMGTVGLQPTYSNKVLMITEKHGEAFMNHAIENAVNAAYATYGFDCVGILELPKHIGMAGGFSESGSAIGRVDDFASCLSSIQGAPSHDAIAIASDIKIDPKSRASYLQSDTHNNDALVNPWGGIEALLTHSLSLIENKPAAHSPIAVGTNHLIQDVGVLDPRMAAEFVSITYLQCILKGLQRSPRLITSESEMNLPGIISARNISAVVIPDGCIGLPTLAALHQGIPVIAVRNNKTVMQNDLDTLPWQDGQLHYVENYMEALGVLVTLKEGLAPGSFKRPIANIPRIKNVG